AGAMSLSPPLPRKGSSLASIIGSRPLPRSAGDGVGSPLSESDSGRWTLRVAGRLAVGLPKPRAGSWSPARADGSGVRSPSRRVGSEPRDVGLGSRGAWLEGSPSPRVAEGSRSDAPRDEGRSPPRVDGRSPPRVDGRSSARVAGRPVAVVGDGSWPP